MARKPKDVLPEAVKRAKKLAYDVGDEVWVKAKVTRIAPYPTMPDLTMITVEMPNGNRETMNLDEDRLRPSEKPAG
jgi:hypothetical protein